MPSDEALRVALVSTLPLLHFSPSLVTVVRSRSTRPRREVGKRRHSSSSAPAIRRARSAHAVDDARFELPSAALTASAVFFQPMSRLTQVGLPAGTGRFWRSPRTMADNKLSPGLRRDTDRSRVSGLFRELTLIARRFPSSVAWVTNDVNS